MNKVEQKLISFSDSPKELKLVKEEINNGWKIVSLNRHGLFYVAILEKSEENEHGEVFIPSNRQYQIFDYS